MTTRFIQVIGEPTETVTLNVKKWEGVFQNITFEKGVPVRLVVFVEDNEAKEALKHLIAAVDDLEGMLVSEMDAHDNWYGEIDGLLNTLEKAREVAERK